MKRTIGSTARLAAGLALYALKAGCGDANKPAHTASPMKVGKVRSVSRWVCCASLALACTAPAWSQGKKPELYDLDANLVLLSPKVKPIYLKALGPLAHEQWLARLDGPAPQNKRVTVAGTEFVHLSSCKNHDCADNSAVFLYSAEQRVLYGTIYQKGKATLIGAGAGGGGGVVVLLSFIKK
jgi:hypothetical protein